MAEFPLPSYVDQPQMLAGYFSKALYFRSVTPREIEHRIGYRDGRLRDGWWLMFLTVLPTAEQFEFRGYSQMSGGIERGHLPETKGNPTAEDRLRAQGANLTGTAYQARGLKQMVIEDVFRLTGPERLAKVRPVADEHREEGIPDFPPGLGIPQWTLTQPLRWVAAAFIRPGQTYLEHYQ